MFFLFRSFLSAAVADQPGRESRRRVPASTARLRARAGGGALPLGARAPPVCDASPPASKSLRQGGGCGCGGGGGGGGCWSFPTRFLPPFLPSSRRYELRGRSLGHRQPTRHRGDRRRAGDARGRERAIDANEPQRAALPRGRPSITHGACSCSPNASSRRARPRRRACGCPPARPARGSSGRQRQRRATRHGAQPRRPRRRPLRSAAARSPRRPARPAAAASTQHPQRGAATPTPPAEPGHTERAVCCTPGCGRPQPSPL